MPIRLRPWFLVFTCLIMALLALSSITNYTGSLRLSDTLLHFICFCIATGVFYFIVDVEEDARRIWYWRHSSLIFTALVCCFFGGIVSEIVQAVLPYKTFRPGAVLANLSGAILGLYLAYHLEKYHRHRREISRLYRPISSEYYSESDDDLGDAGTQLLPMRSQNQSRPSKPTKSTPFRLADVWDEREEVFGVGDDSEEEADVHRPPVMSQGGPPPRIVVTGSNP